MGETLLSLQEIVNRKQEIERDQVLTPIEKSEKIQELKFKVDIFLTKKSYFIRELVLMTLHLISLSLAMMKLI